VPKADALPIRQGKLEEAIATALAEPTLEDALSWICLWESERVVLQAHAFLSGKSDVQADGTGWSTCFKFLIKRVMAEYPKR